jgi:serum/glucocorticoid-regulated kinase 2
MNSLILELDGYIKLADFGLSKENIKDNEVALSLCGSPAYLPPEIVAKKGNKS